MSVLTLLDLPSAFDTIGHHSLLGGNVAGGRGVRGVQYYDYIIIISEVLKYTFYCYCVCKSRCARPCR